MSDTFDPNHRKFIQRSLNLFHDVKAYDGFMESVERLNGLPDLTAATISSALKDIAPRAYRVVQPIELRVIEQTLDRLSRTPRERRDINWLASFLLCAAAWVSATRGHCFR